MYKILDALYSRSVSLPLGISHQELFQSFLDSMEQASSAAGTPRLVKTPTKAPTERRGRPASSTGPKNMKLQRVQASDPGSDPIINALENIKLAIGAIHSRIQNLEKNTASPSSPPTLTLHPSTYHSFPLLLLSLLI
ncbi:unnamed protein product [Lota lota]